MRRPRSFSNLPSGLGFLAAAVLLLSALWADSLFLSPVGWLPREAVLLTALVANLLAAGTTTGIIWMSARSVGPVAVLVNATLMLPSSAFGGFSSYAGVAMAALIAIQASGWLAVRASVRRKRGMEAARSADSDVLARILPILGSAAATAAAAAWLWLVMDAQLALRDGDLDVFAIAYGVIGIITNLAASLVFARFGDRLDDSSWAIVVLANVATLTLFSDESPFARLSSQAASILLLVLVVQGAALLLLQRKSQQAEA